MKLEDVEMFCPKCKLKLENLNCYQWPHAWKWQITAKGYCPKCSVAIWMKIGTPIKELIKKFLS